MSTYTDQMDRILTRISKKEKELLLEIRKHLSKEMGLSLSMGQTIQIIHKHYLGETK